MTPGYIRLLQQRLRDRVAELNAATEAFHQQVPQEQPPEQSALGSYAGYQHSAPQGVLG